MVKRFAVESLSNSPGALCGVFDTERAFSRARGETNPSGSSDSEEILEGSGAFDESGVDRPATASENLTGLSSHVNSAERIAPCEFEDFGIARTPSLGAGKD